MLRVFSKTVLLMIAVATLVLIVAGCGADQPEPETITVVETVEVTREVEGQTITVVETVEVIQTVEPEREVPVAKEVVTLAYNGYFDQTFGPADTPITALREEVAKVYPEIEVQLNIMPYEAGPWRDNYLAWFQAEDGNTDLIGVGLYWLPEFAEVGWLTPLDDLISQDVIDELNPTYLEAFTYNGDLLALGPWWGGIGGLYYRKDLLEEYGYEPPETYDELVDIAQSITAENPELTGWTWPALKDQVLVNRWVEFLNGFGGTYFDDSGQCAMNNEDGVAALEFMISLFEEGITPQEALTWKEEDSQIRFTSGEALFHSGRQDMMFWLNDPEQSAVVDQWGFVPMPGTEGAGAGFFEGWGFAINKYSDNPEAAAKVLEVMFGFAVQKAFNLSQGPVQAHMGVYTDPDVIANNPNMPLIEEVAQTAIAPIPSPALPDISSILQEELHTALIGGKSAQASLDDACSRIDELDLE